MGEITTRTVFLLTAPSSWIVYDFKVPNYVCQHQIHPLIQLFKMLQRKKYRKTTRNVLELALRLFIDFSPMLKFSMYTASIGPFQVWLPSTATHTAWCSEIGPLTSLMHVTQVHWQWRQRTNFTAPGCTKSICWLGIWWAIKTLLPLTTWYQSIHPSRKKIFTDFFKFCSRSQVMNKTSERSFFFCPVGFGDAYFFSQVKIILALE